MNGANRNTFWASIVVDELARSGIRQAVIAPGSRSTPLALALYASGQFTIHSVIDERAAAFLALGMGLASGTPAVLVCTSGTAAANFFPAIIEASQSDVPMLVLTADRPHELRDSGANQTVDQVKLYGGYVRWFVDVAPPQPAPDDHLLRSLRTTVNRAVAVSMGANAGPVHLNIPFDKPLEDTFVEGDVPASTFQALGAQGREDQRPFTTIRPLAHRVSTEDVETLTAMIKDNPHSLILAGPGKPSSARLAAWLAETTGFPLLAEPLSGLRLSKLKAGAVISGYETFLRGEFARTVQPTLILQIGAMPVSAALLDYLGSAKDARRVLLSESGRWSDGFHLLERVISGDHHGLLRALQSASVVKRIVDPAWLEVWMAADQTAWDALDALRGRESVEGAVAADLVDLLPEGTVLFAANSGPVRHLDQFIRGQQKDIIVYANRGASGIDGSLATALGVASASGRPAALLTGDLALYHDLNSLHLIQRLGIDLHVVVINNDGGGIFHRLPIADQGAPFRELFQTPHGLSFEHAAALFNLGYGRAEDAGDFREVFSAVLKTAHPHLVEIFSDPAQFEKQRRELNQTVIEQLAPIHAL